MFAASFELFFCFFLVLLSRSALLTIEDLSNVVDLSEFASCIIHPIVRVLEVAAIRSQAMDTLCSVVLVLGQKYCYFIPLVGKVGTTVLAMVTAFFSHLFLNWWQKDASTFTLL